MIRKKKKKKKKKKKTWMTPGTNKEENKDNY